MSYCVNCGVELDKTAHDCALCQTPVMNPRQPVDTFAPLPFPTVRREVPIVVRTGFAILISAMLLSVSVCCGILNLFFLRPDKPWCLYIIGAAIMLWIWFVPPLLWRAIPLLVRLFLDVAAVGIYVFLISLDLNGSRWFMGLAMPIILTSGAILLFMGLLLQNHKRSILTSITLMVGAVACIAMAIEYFLDRWFLPVWTPTWSIIVATICIALVIPLIIVRRVPTLREEVRRRFHL